MTEPRIYTFVKGESRGGKDMKRLVRFFLFCSASIFISLTGRQGGAGASVSPVLAFFFLPLATAPPSTSLPKKN